MRILAVDLGASSGRTIVGEVEAGRIALEETHRFANGMVETDGSKRWDVDALLKEIKTGIAASGPLDGIGIDTWGVDYGLLDADGTLLEAPFAYRDGRHETAVPEVYRLVPKERLYAITGMQELPFNTIFQLVAEGRDRPDLHQRAHRMLMMPELLTYLLTGRMQSEYSISSTTGLLNARRRDWDHDLIRTLGLPERLFGSIAMPGARVGEYEGTPVFCPAMHDTGSAVAAIPAVEDGQWAYLSSGTWSILGAELADPILTEDAARANFTNEGGVDGRIRFLKNINGLWLIQECRRLWAEGGNAMSFAEIADAADASDYAATIDPNDPRYLAPENMVGEILADLKSRGEAAPDSEGDLARCCYLSLARAYRRELDRLQAVTGRQFDRLHIVGGGCKADLLNRLTADAVGIPVHVGPAEATAIGNLCVQAKACGEFADLAQTRRAVAEAFAVQVYEPTGG